MMNYNYNLTNIIADSEKSSVTPMWLNVGKYSFGLVNNHNGKRLTLSKSIADKLGLTDEAFILSNVNEGIIIISKTAISTKSCPCPLKGTDRKTCYNAKAVKEITKAFNLDYSNCSSKSFSDIVFDEVNGTPVAIINLRSAINDDDGETA